MNGSKGMSPFQSLYSGKGAGPPIRQFILGKRLE